MNLKDHTSAALCASLLVLISVGCTAAQYKTNSDVDGAPVMQFAGDTFLYYTVNNSLATEHVVSIEFKTKFSNCLLWYAASSISDTYYLIVFIDADGFLTLKYTSYEKNNNTEEFSSKLYFEKGFEEEDENGSEGSGSTFIDDEESSTDIEGFQRRRRSTIQEFDIRMDNDQWHVLSLVDNGKTDTDVLIQSGDTRKKITIPLNLANIQFLYVGNYFISYEDEVLALHPSQECCILEEGQISFLSKTDHLHCMHNCHLHELLKTSAFVGSMRRFNVNGKYLTSSDLAIYSSRGPKLVPAVISTEQDREICLTLLTEASFVHVNDIDVFVDVSLSSFEWSVEIMLWDNCDGVIMSGILLEDGEADNKNWRLYCTGTRLIVHTERSRSLTEVVELGKWLQIKLYTTPSAFITEINEKLKLVFPGNYKLMTTLVLGHQNDSAIASFRKLRFDSIDYDLRKLVRHRHKVSLGCSQPYSRWCGKGKMVSLTDRVQSCDCSNTGHQGKFCHREMYPKSCEEHKARGARESGRYIITVGDTPVNVLCLFNDGLIRTEVQSNIPKNFEMDRNLSAIADVSISYSSTDINSQLSSWAHEGDCEQTISFSCEQLRVYLKERRQTANSSAVNNCSCTDTEVCSPISSVCNCIDGLVVRNPDFLPLSNLRSRFTKNGLSAKRSSSFSVGPFVCIKPSITSSPWSLTGNYSLGTTVLMGSTLGFSIRTRQEDVVLLHANWDSTSLVLSLRQGNVLRAIYTSTHLIKTEIVPLTYFLNDAQWQHFLISFDDDEIILIVNGYEKVLTTPNSGISTRGKKFFACMGSYCGMVEKDPLPSLVGCVDGITIDFKPLTSSVITSPFVPSSSSSEFFYYSPSTHSTSSAVHTECNDPCSSLSCNNGGTCFVNITNLASCICVHPFYGKHCQFDLNISSVYLSKHDAGFYWMQKDIWANHSSSPITQDFTLSFRTRENKAKILFTYDNLQNIVQLYLTNSNEMSLLFNSRYNLVAVHVNSKDIRLDLAKDVQVSVTRTVNLVKLKVNVDGNEFESTLDSPHELITEYIRYPYSSDPLQYMLPYYPQPVTAPKPFLMIHIGGAENAFFEQIIPDFIGCITSFYINEQEINLRDATLWNVEGDVESCPSSCSTKNVCGNGGQCIDQFVPDHSPCDCTHTGYHGTECREEISYDFGGMDWVSLDPFVPSGATSVEEFELAFSYSPTGKDTSSLLFLFNDGVKELGVALVNDDHLMFWTASMGRCSYSHLHDWQMHTLLSLGGRHLIRVALDVRGVHLFFNNRRVPVTWQQKNFIGIITPSNTLFIGGVNKSIDIDGVQVSGFTGCISNVRVVFNTSEVLEPLHFADSTPGIHSELTLSKLNHVTQCSAPAAPVLVGAPKMISPMNDDGSVSLPPPRIDYTLEQSPPPEEPTQSNSLLILIIGISIACIFLVIVLAVGMWWYAKRLQQRSLEQGTPKASFRRKPKLRPHEGLTNSLMTDVYPQHTVLREESRVLPHGTGPVEMLQNDMNGEEASNILLNNADNQETNSAIYEKMYDENSFFDEAHGVNAQHSDTFAESPIIEPDSPELDELENWSTTECEMPTLPSQAKLMQYSIKQLSVISERSEVSNDDDRGRNLVSNESYQLLDFTRNVPPERPHLSNVADVIVDNETSESDSDVKLGQRFQHYIERENNLPVTQLEYSSHRKVSSSSCSSSQSSRNSAELTVPMLATTNDLLPGIDRNQRFEEPNVDANANAGRQSLDVEGEEDYLHFANDDFLRSAPPVVEHCVRTASIMRRSYLPTI